MQILGLQKTSLIDYPPYTSCVIFTGGCNFKCPYCQNVDIVNGTSSEIFEEDFFEFLEKRKNWLDAVVITGGEPTIHADLVEFVQKIKDRGFKVKLDTNGSNPNILKKLLKTLDFVAMDIKAPLEDYNDVTRTRVDKEKIQESIDLLMNSNVDYEFRTTVLPDFFTLETAHTFSEWLKGAKSFAIQQFRSNSTLDPTFAKKEVYCKDSLLDFKRILGENIENVEVRGA